MSKKVVVASGYFDPIHYGHIEYLKQSKDLGDTLIVIVNNDRQATLKKGKPFMKAAERVKLVRSLECVDAAIESLDDDRTVCKTLGALHPDIFANGGDQFNTSIPEAKICNELGIEMRDGLGGKIQSSSWLLKDAKKHEEEKKSKECKAYEAEEIPKKSNQASSPPPTSPSDEKADSNDGKHEDESVNETKEELVEKDEKEADEKDDDKTNEATAEEEDSTKKQSAKKKLKKRKKKAPKKKKKT